MQSILILGTQWLAEEMFDLVSEMPGYEVVGFVENLDRARCEAEIEARPVYWVDELPKLAADHRAICGISTTHRWKYVDQVRALGMPFATIVHPTARVSSRAVLGEGCFVGPMAVVSTRSTLGDHVFMNRGAFVGHHSKVGNYVTLQPGANVAGLTDIGERTYVGMNAAITDRVKVGEGCIVGAGSLVGRDLPAHVLAMGVPARILETDVEGK